MSWDSPFQPTPVRALFAVTGGILSCLLIGYGVVWEGTRELAKRPNVEFVEETHLVDDAGAYIEGLLDRYRKRQTSGIAQADGGLVMDLLSYSKERAPEYEPCHPNEIAEDVCELLDNVAQDHDVAMVKQFSDKMQPVVMDPRTVHRCLMNLVTNAIDACIFDPDVDKAHQVTVVTDMEGKETVRFDVKDNGCGMTEEVRAKLFSSFFSTKGVKGTGLGLLVTAKLIEEHKGSIDVESVEGEGTTFILRFPAQMAEGVSPDGK